MQSRKMGKRKTTDLSGLSIATQGHTSNSKDHHFSNCLIFDMIQCLKKGCVINQFWTWVVVRRFLSCRTLQSLYCKKVLRIFLRGGDAEGGISQVCPGLLSCVP